MRDPFDVIVGTLSSLSMLESEGDVLAAAILHVVPGLRERLEPRLAREFPSVGIMLEGQRAAAQVWALHAERGKSGSSEGLRRLLLAIVRDLRVVPILLARQLARMRHAARLPAEQRIALAQLTRDIHAPLANRLGIWQLKWELEDLAFRHLEPDTYQRIARLLDDKRSGRERYVAQVTRVLGDALAAQSLHAEVAGRPKHIYSIWKKMQKKNVPIGELYDLRAVRVLVDDVPACYAALGVVHALWAPVPSEFDDYIARPKRNDYRSLHTAVIGPEGKTLEVQIRTFEMHAQAELGVAAHWRYKEGRGVEHRSAAANAALDRKIEWMRRLLEHMSTAGMSTADGRQRRPHGRDRQRTGRGSRLRADAQGRSGRPAAGRDAAGFRLPRAYRGRPSLPWREGRRADRAAGPPAAQRRPRRDHRRQDRRAAARLARRVQRFLASARSREKCATGSTSSIARATCRRGANCWTANSSASACRMRIPRRRCSASTRRRSRTCRCRWRSATSARTRCRARCSSMNARGTTPRRHRCVPLRAAARRRRRQDSRSSVVGNLLVQVARCCQPLPGEPIGGYLTRGHGVSVHRSDCATFQRLSATQPQRLMPVEWGRRGGGSEADVLVDAVDRKWLLKDVTNLVAQEDAHVLDLHAEAMRGGGRVRLRLRLRVADYGQLSRLLGKLDGLAGVERAHRA